MTTRLTRFFDYRFLVTLTILVLVSTLCFGFIRRVNQADDLIKNAEHSLDISKQQTDQIDALMRLNADRSAQASAERDNLTDQIERLRQQLASLTKYLKDQGLQLPTAPTAEPEAVVPAPSSSPTPQSVAVPSKPHVPAAPSPATGPSPATTPSPMPPLLVAKVCVLMLCLPQIG